MAVVEDASNTKLESDLITKDWYALNHFHGTSEEQSLVQFLIDTIENFKEKYENVYLLRNEQVYKIYDFKDGKGFEPDFLLFLKEKEADRYYQVFIEPKGDHLRKQDQWKEDFLLSLSEREDIEILSENDDVRLIGLKFYSTTTTLKNDFRDDFNEKLLQ